jgi:ribulose-5-phosphate 4-epimerase/fuculose-1-phosphate aldolase
VPSFQDAQVEVVRAAQFLYQKGFLSATGGNVSLRIAEANALAITPSDYDYLKMLPEDVCVLSMDLTPLEGQRSGLPNEGASDGRGSLVQQPRGLLNEGASPSESDGYAREKNAGSVNSSAIDATEDVLSRRPARPDGRGSLVQQPLKPSIESAMHSAIYQVRPDVQAIIHTHQVYTSTLATINAPIPALFDEQVRFLGRSVEIIPYRPSGTGMLRRQVAKHVRNNAMAYMMANHGALVFGTGMESAIHNVEVLEKCALAYLLAICSEKKVGKVPLLVREVAFAKLRADQKKAAGE